MIPAVEIKPEEPKKQEPVAEAPPAASTPEVPETEKDINWRKFREQRELDRKAREQAEKLAQEERQKAEAMKAAMEALLDKPSQQQNRQDTYNNNDSSEETEEKRIERQVNAILAQREAIAQKEREAREQQEYPQRLLREYSDFNQVVQEANLDYLEFHYPEVAGPISQMPQGYNRWAAIYKAVKKFVPNVEAKRDMKKAEVNSLKPQGGNNPVPPTGTSSGPAIRIDEARRAANWERMQKVLKGLT